MYNMKILKQYFIISLCIFLLPLLCKGSDWMNWRGPFYNGTGEAKNLPISWSLDEKENIAWVIELPGKGSSTPIIAGDHIFITSSIKADKSLLAICVSKKNGKILWEKKLGTGRKVKRNNMASSSAVTDGKHVYFSFGQGTFACMNFKGKILWKINLEKKYGKFNTKFGYSSSPLLYNGKLYIPIIRWLPRGMKISTGIKTDSLLLAIDPATGKTLWHSIRNTDAVKESKDSYVTPLPYKYGNNHGIILSGADEVTCNDPESGKQIWRYLFAEERDERWRLVPTPVTANGLIFFTFPRGEVMRAIKPDKKNFSKTPKMVWEHKGNIPDVCSPAVYKGLLFVLDTLSKHLTCFEPSNGKIVWEKKLPSRKNFFSSPTIADNKIYCINLGGDVFVLSADRKGELLAKFSLVKVKSRETCAASITVSGSSLFVRTPTKLMRVKAK